MASEMIERAANAMREAADVGSETMYEDMARAAIEAMRELPSYPGPRYTAGEYSRRTQEAMVDDALNAPDLMPVYGSKPVED